MSNYQLTVDIIGPSGLQKALLSGTKHYRQALANAINKAAHEIEGKAKEYAPHKTGALRGSLHTETATAENLKATVGTNIVYARAQEMGREPFTILPVNKKALYWKGAAHPVKVVHHPGLAGKFYLQRAKCFRYSN